MAGAARAAVDEAVGQGRRGGAEEEEEGVFGLGASGVAERVLGAGVVWRGVFLAGGAGARGSVGGTAGARRGLSPDPGEEHYW